MGGRCHLKYNSFFLRLSSSLGIVGSLLDLVGLHSNAVLVGVAGLLGLGEVLPSLGKGLGLLLEVQMGKLARLTQVLGVEEEVGERALGCVGVLERRETLLARLAQLGAALVLELVLSRSHLLETVLGLLLESLKVGAVSVLVGLSSFIKKVIRVSLVVVDYDAVHDIE